MMFYEVFHVASAAVYIHKLVFYDPPLIYYMYILLYVSSSLEMIIAWQHTIALLSLDCSTASALGLRRTQQCPKLRQLRL